MSSCPEQVRIGCHSRLDRESISLWRVAVLWAAALISSAVWAQGAADYPGIGRAATEREVKAWDIDVRPDFKGLPPGSGSVKKGQEVWEAKCASCHGVFGEATEVFSPLVGGVKAQDIQAGRVANLADPVYPARTTMMKLSSLSTLWDYIFRAMPWNEPKSLSADEVYALSAYMLNLANVLPDHFTLTDKNMAAVQGMLPNRQGMSSAHALWPGRGLPGQTAKPDVQGTACMKDCAAEPKVASILPAYARDAHGNLAEQNRLIGAQRGADTTRAEVKAPSGAAQAAQAALPPAAPVGAAGATPGAALALGKAPDAKVPEAKASPASGAAFDIRAAQALAQKSNCTACHAPSAKLVGPSWADIAARHSGKSDYLAGKIKTGGSGQWGPIPMPPQALGEADAKAIAAWLAAGPIR